MAKLMTFIMIIVGIMLLLNLAGIETTESNIMKQVGLVKTTGDFQSTPFYVALLVAIGVMAGAAAIFAGFFSSGNFITVVAAATMGGLLGTFLSDIILLSVKAGQRCDPTQICSDWVYYVVWAITIPIAFGYALSIFEWMTGDH